ncbi:MAG: hypothetical protein AB7O57_06115 [Hyphomicrobiaceae bacterium]
MLPRGAAAAPPRRVADWLHRASDPPFRVPLDYVGLHSDHGLGKAVPAPTYAYDATRAIDVDDGIDMPATQWSLIEREPGSYDWRAVEAWIKAHPGKTRIWVLFGTPTFHQKYPGEPWRYPYLPGGGSPPRDPAAAARFIRSLLDRFPGQIRFIEVCNEPNFGYGPGASAGRWTKAMGRPGFFTGTPEDLAALSRSVRAVLPKGVELMAGAWEGQSEGGSPLNSLLRFSRASDGAGGFGRDHVDALSVHSYTYHHDPNKMIAELRGYRQRFAEAGYRPGLAAYVTEAGAEAPGTWSATHPPLADKVRIMKRWLLIPAALGYSGTYLYKHSIMPTLGDPAREPALGAAITAMRDALRGRLLVEAARLIDDSIWLSFADGTTVEA